MLAVMPAGWEDELNVDSVKKLKAVLCPALLLISCFPKEINELDEKQGSSHSPLITSWKKLMDNGPNSAFCPCLLAMVLPKTGVKKIIQRYAENTVCRQFIHFMVTVELSQKVTKGTP